MDNFLDQHNLGIWSTIPETSLQPGWEKGLGLELALLGECLGVVLTQGGSGELVGGCGSEALQYFRPIQQLSQLKHLQRRRCLLRPVCLVKLVKKTTALCGVGRL